MENKLFSELTFDEQKLILKDVMKDVLPYDTTVNGDYYLTSYIDSNDCLDEHNIKQIVNSVKPQYENCYSETINRCYEWWAESISDDWTDLIDKVIEVLIDKYDFDEDDVEDNRFEIEEILHDFVFIDPPTDELMKKSKLNVVISLDNDNENFSSLDTYFESDTDIIEKFKGTSIEWLVNQQGYTMEQFKDAFENESSSKFLNSLVQEFKEVYDYSALEFTFLSYMNVYDLFVKLWKENNNAKINKTITISKDATCGLLDGWYNGVCGYFVELEKDVVIPANFLSMDAAFPDCCYNYGADNIAGFTSKAWRDSDIKID